MNRKGYSLFEILAVLAIIAITASLVTMKIQESINKIEIATCQNKMKLIALSEKRYFTTKGQHSLEFISGEEISETCQLVRQGYLDWDSINCDSSFVWSINEDGDYILTCVDHNELNLLQEKEEYNNALFVQFPDDGITTGGTGDPPHIEPTPGDDIITGTPGSDIIDALNGDDIINGLGGDDILFGNNGKDTIYGGQGDDILSGGNNNDIISGGENDDYISGGNGNDTITGDSGDDIIDGGNGKDVIQGGTGIDTIYGNNGNDQIFGGEGDDDLYGEAGADKISGGPGNDTIYGGSGTNTAIYEYDYQEYTLLKYSKYYYVISHPLEGTDHLFDIDKLKFPNKTDKIKNIYNLIG